jgi:hypothetical protein
MGVLTSPSPSQGLAFAAPDALISAFPLALVSAGPASLDVLVPLSKLLPLAPLNQSRQTEPAQQFSRLSLAARGGN